MTNAVEYLFLCLSFSPILIFFLNHILIEYYTFKALLVLVGEGGVKRVPILKRVGNLHREN